MPPKRQPINAALAGVIKRHSKNRLDDAALESAWATFRRCRLPKSREAAKQPLIGHFLPLVAQVAFRLYGTLPHNSFLELDDLIQEGTFGLSQAIDGFRPKLGNAFSTYAPLRIRGAMLDAIRNSDWVPRLVRRREKEGVETSIKLKSLNQPTGKNWSPEKHYHQNPLGDVLVNEKSHPGSRPLESMDALRMFTKGLRRNERLIIILYYYEELTMREIGDQLGLSESRVSQMHSEILKRMRESASVIEAAGHQRGDGKIGGHHGRLRVRIKGKTKMVNRATRKRGCE